MNGMKIYDISQELFTCKVYPGDDAPQKQDVRRTSRGDLYNLTNFSMCAHNGTHLDAPFHFLEDGKTVDEIPLEKTVGECYVAEFSGEMTAANATNILEKAKNISNEAAKRILIKGDAVITEESASVFAENEIYLIGVESQSVGDESKPMEVHKILLKKEVVLLEGIRLSSVDEGSYFLNAAPINLGGCDGAPCRAVLVEIS